MIKITSPNGESRWLNISSIQHIYDTKPDECMVVTERCAWVARFSADDLAKRINKELRGIHHTPDYRE